MLYTAVQTYADFRMPGRHVAESLEQSLGNSTYTLTRGIRAFCSLVAQIGTIHSRPAFNITKVKVGSRHVPVIEECVIEHPWCSLLHFKKDMRTPGPKILVVAPLSGHYATLVKGTVAALLTDHDVYVTDWQSARELPLSAGSCDLDDNIDLLMHFLKVLGPDLHIIGICQASVTVAAAVSLLSEETPQMAPRSMVLVGGPIDTRINPTAVNHFAAIHQMAWFEHGFTTVVPLYFKGRFRKVYPGFLQLSNFVSMNWEKHLAAYREMYFRILEGNDKAAVAQRSFYSEYRSVMDLPADFYVETIRRVFKEHLLPQGKFESRGRMVRPEAVTKTGLMTVEGERDDICGAGQTRAALELFTGIPQGRMDHHLQEGVGHYGTFSGRRFRQETYPKLRAFIAREQNRRH